MYPVWRENTIDKIVHTTSILGYWHCAVLTWFNVIRSTTCNSLLFPSCPWYCICDPTFLAASQKCTSMQKHEKCFHIYHHHIDYTTSFKKTNDLPFDTKSPFFYFFSQYLCLTLRTELHNHDNMQPRAAEQKKIGNQAVCPRDLTTDSLIDKNQQILTYLIRMLLINAL